MTRETQADAMIFNAENMACYFPGSLETQDPSRAAFLKLWSADHKWSSGSAFVVLLD